MLIYYYMFKFGSKILVNIVNSVNMFASNKELSVSQNLMKGRRNL